jgi:hypothetical protein
MAVKHFSFFPLPTGNLCMRDSGIAGLVLAFLATGIIATFVTGDYAFWFVLVPALFFGVWIANQILRR